MWWQATLPKDEKTILANHYHIYADDFIPFLRVPAYRVHLLVRLLFPIILTDIPTPVVVIPPLFLLQVRDKKRAEIKKLQDDFRALLESVDPPITVDSEWEDVKEGLIGKPTFDSMPRNDRYDAFKVCQF